jgi:hypothetical protein
LVAALVGAQWRLLPRASKGPVLCLPVFGRGKPSASQAGPSV